MSTLPDGAPRIEGPDISGVAIDDGAPVENLYSEKLMRLLTEPLYASWTAPTGEDASPRPGATLEFELSDFNFESLNASAACRIPPFTLTDREAVCE